MVDNRAWIAVAFAVSEDRQKQLDFISRMESAMLESLFQLETSDLEQWQLRAKLFNVQAMLEEFTADDTTDVVRRHSLLVLCYGILDALSRPLPPSDAMEERAEISAAKKLASRKARELAQRMRLAAMHPKKRPAAALRFKARLRPGE